MFWNLREQSYFTIHYLLLTALLRWWSKVTVSDESRPRRIVFLTNASGPHVGSAFLPGLDYEVIFFAACCDCNLALQVGAIQLCVCALKPIQNILCGMTITVPLTARDDCDCGFDTINEVLSSGVLG